jgi:branched-chain amino acid transport system permease protein
VQFPKSLFIVIALLVGIPFVVSNYWVFLFTEVLILALFATSFNLLLGYTGLVSFGQAAFYAVGAYATALILKHMSTSLWAALGGEYWPLSSFPS